MVVCPSKLPLHGDVAFTIHLNAVAKLLFQVVGM
jgi:hypothetical protein